MSTMHHISRLHDSADKHRTYRYEQHASVNSLPADVVELLERTAILNVSCGADWYRTLCTSIPSLGSLAEFHVLRRNDGPIAVLPLVRSAGLDTLAALSNYYTALYAPGLVDDVSADELALLLSAVLDRRPRLASLRLHPMDRDSPAYEKLRRAMSDCGLFAFPYFCFGNWSLPRPADLGHYMANRPGDLRSTLARKGKLFAAAGGQMEILSRTDDLARGIAAYQQVYATSWKTPEPHPLFISTLIETCARRGWLRLGIAWLGGRPVATQLWIVANGRAEIYKLAYDESFKRYSPGTLLTAKLLEQVFEIDGVREIDYLIGDDRYKTAWMTQRRERWGLIAYNPATSAGLAALAREVAVRFAKSLLAWARHIARRRTTGPA